MACFHYGLDFELAPERARSQPASDFGGSDFGTECLRFPVGEWPYCVRVFCLILYK